MSLIIDSAPDCIQHVDGAKPPDDVADFVVQAPFLPLGFLSGWLASFIMKKLNLLRVPPIVELEGLDLAEYETDFYPEHMHAPEKLVDPDGTPVLAEPILTQEYRDLMELNNGGAPPPAAPAAREPVG